MRPSAFFSVEKIEVSLAIITINIQLFINHFSNQMSIQRCNSRVQRSRHASYTGFLNQFILDDEPDRMTPSINLVAPPRTPERMVRSEIVYTPSTRNRTPVTGVRTLEPIPSAVSQRALNITPTILFPMNDEEMPTRTCRQLAEPVAQPFHADTCSICMEDLKPTDLFVTRCGHQFHGTCMLNHITIRDTNNDCPTCRGHIL